LPLAESDEVNSWIYAGPARISELSSHGLKFQKALFPVLSWARHIFWAGSWFPPLSELILITLLFFYGLVKDYGIAIILLTLLTKIITYPMTQSSTKSMMKMKDIAPKLTELRQKYKSNPQKMNQEMMALYKAEGINPFNPGCLPMFLQMPIFIALFVVLRKAIELRGASSFVLPWVKDLSQPEALFTLPFAIPIYGSNVALVPIIMAILTFIQQKQVMTDPNQKMMVYLMPIIMLVMFNGFPAGVVFYWTVSSALGLAQQTWLKPKSLSKPAAAGATGATATVTTGGVSQKVPVKKPSGGSSGGKKRKHKR
jgi:YidC/Oxa1 family membrane protein insertase